MKLDQRRCIRLKVVKHLSVATLIMWFKYWLRRVNATNKLSKHGFPNSNGTISTLVFDGSGGWYIGGYFSAVGSVAVSLILRMKSDNTVDANFNKSCNSRVRAVVRVSNRLYIGGDFTSVNGLQHETMLLRKRKHRRGYGCMIRHLTAQYTHFTILATSVNINDTTLWLGGGFTTINSRYKPAISCKGQQHQWQFCQWNSKYKCAG